MVSFDPFTAQLMANNPHSLLMESTSLLTTPPIQAGDDSVDIPVGKAHITQANSQSSLTFEEANHSDLHEFDGAECCDLGSSVSGLEPEAFHILPLLPVDPPANNTSAPAPQPTEHSPTHHNLDSNSDTCSSCGLNKASPVHYSLHPAGPDLQSVSPSPRHGRPSNCLSTIAPGIEAAALCPDIESPTSPRHDHKSDPFEVYMDHERHHQRQGRSHLFGSFSADSAARELDSDEARRNETSSTEDTTQGHPTVGEGARLHHMNPRFQNERIVKAREQLLFGNERVEEAMRAELTKRGLGKPSGLVEVGVIETGY